MQWNRNLFLASLLALAAACGKDEPKAPQAEEPATEPAAERSAPEAKSTSKGLLIALARFAVEDGRATAKPLPARAEFLYQEDGDWKLAGFEDEDSNVFHKVMAFEDSLLTFGGMAAAVKQWRLVDGEFKAETLWTEDFGGRFNRMRDAEIGDLDGNGKPVLAIATHDQGIVALLRDIGKSNQVEKIDAETNTFVHEIEIGDLDGDGTLEVYATPSEPNRLGVEQSGKVVRYVPKRGEGRVVVADLGMRHAKEIFVGDVDGDGKDELYVAVEAKTSGSGASLTIDEPVEIRFPDGCVVLLRAYRSEDRSGQPAWDPMRGSLFCTMILVEFTLSPGESREFQATASAPEILGDSLPAGRYFFTALLRPNGGTVEVPAGQADLQR